MKIPPLELPDDMVATLLQDALRNALTHEIPDWLKETLARVARLEQLALGKPALPEGATLAEGDWKNK